MTRPRRVVVLTGAGISQESGLKTFRDGDGLWEGHHVEDVATPEAFERNPALVYDFYNQRRRQLQSGDVQPNAAHRALAAFEQRFDGEFLLVTQNVDDLHTRAGSKKLLHMHGELLRARCLDTGEIFPWKDDLDHTSVHPYDAKRKGRLRPHIVWFGEMPLAMERIELALAECDLFVAIGTSGLVYPAAGFVSWTPRTCRRVEINLHPTAVGSRFEESVSGPASVAVPQFFDAL